MGAKWFGPQIPGGHYHNGYWHYDYEVISIEDGVITIRKDDGSVVAHRTAWDVNNDRQVGQPCRRVYCKWGR